MKRNLVFVVLFLFGSLSCSKNVLLGKPTASFSWTPTTLTAPVTVSFTSTSSNAKEFSWNFGDGNTSTLENPTNRYTTPGTYQVNLTVRNPSAPQDIQFSTSTQNLTIR